MTIVTNPPLVCHHLKLYMVGDVGHRFVVR